MPIIATRPPRSSTWSQTHASDNQEGRKGELEEGILCPCTLCRYTSLCGWLHSESSL